MDYAYLGLGSGIEGLSGGGTIAFSAPIGNQSTSGVPIKVGDRPSDVPVPGTIALIGAGLLALGFAIRRRSTYA